MKQPGAKHLLAPAQPPAQVTALTRSGQGVASAQSGMLREQSPVVREQVTAPQVLDFL